MAQPGSASVAASRRLRLMGLEVEELADCAVARLPLGSAPFDTPDGPLRLEELRFASVGTDRIKCLSPEPLFHLPLLSIRGCGAPADLEAVVRRAWAERRTQVRRAQAWLEALGASPAPLAAGAALELPLGLEDESARAIVIGTGRLVLPGRGPLSGIALHRASDRVQHADPSCSSATDLELAVTNRLEKLAHAEGQRARMRVAAATRGRREPKRRGRRSRG